MPTQRKIFWAVGLLFIVLLCLGWLIARNNSPVEKQHPVAQTTPVSVNTPAANTRSRMIEADPAELQQTSKNNAASDYLKAFALADKLTKREQEIIKNNPPANPPAAEEEIASLLLKIRPILALLLQGATKPTCDWGLGKLTMDTPLPFLLKASQISRIALWDMQNRTKQSPENSVLTFRAIDHFGSQITIALVGSLVNMAIHVQMTKFLADNAASFSSDDRIQFAKAVAEQELVVSLQNAIHTESDFLHGSLEFLEISQHTDGSPLNEVERKGYGIANGTLHTALFKQSLGVLSILDQSIYWTDEQYYAQVSKIGHAADAFGIYSNSRGAMRSAIVQQTMAQAGLAVLNEGSDALTRFADPLTGEVFSYKVANDQRSFELQSTVVNKGKPVTLTFKMPAL